MEFLGWLPARPFAARAGHTVIVMFQGLLRDLRGVNALLTVTHEELARWLWRHLRAAPSPRVPAQCQPASTATGYALSKTRGVRAYPLPHAAILPGRRRQKRLQWQGRVLPQPSFAGALHLQSHGAHIMHRRTKMSLAPSEATIATRTAVSCVLGYISLREMLEQVQQKVGMFFRSEAFFIATYSFLAFVLSFWSSPSNFGLFPRHLCRYK